MSKYNSDVNSSVEPSQNSVSELRDLNHSQFDSITAMSDTTGPWRF